MARRKPKKLLTEKELLSRQGFHEDLVFTAKVLYYRFEFFRHGPNEIGFLTEMLGGGFIEPRYKGLLPPRLTKRKKFINNPGQPTYLDELKADMDDICGTEMEELVTRNILDWGILPGPPAYNFSMPLRPPPFWPHPDEVEDRLVDYFNQLFDLQDYLFDEFDLPQGQFLPVWKAEELMPKHSLGKRARPIICSIPSRKRIVNALTAFLLWREGWQDHYYDEPALSGAKNSPEYLDRALEYMWSKQYWEKVISSFEANMDHYVDVEGRFKDFSKLPAKQRHKIMQEFAGQVPKYADDLVNLPTNKSEFVAFLTQHCGMPDQPRINKRKDFKKGYEAQLTPKQAANDPNTRKKVEAAATDPDLSDWTEFW